MNDKKEVITHEALDKDAWHCICGNMPDQDGFFPCDKQGNEIEPVEEWAKQGSLYVCAGCKRIIDPETLEVVSRG